MQTWEVDLWVLLRVFELPGIRIQITSGSLRHDLVWLSLFCTPPRIIWGKLRSWPGGTITRALGWESGRCIFLSSNLPLDTCWSRVSYFILFASIFSFLNWAGKGHGKLWYLCQETPIRVMESGIWLRNNCPKRTTVRGSWMAVYGELSICHF